jgi:tetratricopeptide (TPR) repeat protein
MADLFNKENVQIHEPINLQIADIKQYHPNTQDLILNGVDCDCLPNGDGPFGTINNPIPVNGAIGEIKYLGKLRGKTGHAVFFHRLANASSTATDKPVDLYELVCHDGTQWTKLYFDLYHPRRSNMCPEGFCLVPYDKDLKMDIPFAYGVDFMIENFPYGIENLLDKFYGTTGSFGRHAQKWLQEYKFVNPLSNQAPKEKTLENTEKIQPKEKETSTLISEIQHYEFITGVINEVLSFEKEMIKTKSDELLDFKCPNLFNPQFYTRFMIERFLYINACVQYFNLNFSLDEMKNYVNSISMKEYNFSNTESLNFFEKRIKFYEKELEMLSTFKYPHPGKIIWSLYNPSNDEISHDLNSMFESNIACFQLFHIINKTITEELSEYNKLLELQLNNNSKALSLFQTGLELEKTGDYEKALDCFIKAKELSPSIKSLNAHILIANFWSGDLNEHITHFKDIFDSINKEVETNPDLIDLFNTRAWLCYYTVDGNAEIGKDTMTYLLRQAYNDFTKCISLEPSNAELYKQRAFYLSFINGYNEALKDINKAIELKPDYSRYFKERAILYQKIGKIDNALIDIDKALLLCEDERWEKEYMNLKQKLKI